MSLNEMWREVRRLRILLSAAEYKFQSSTSGGTTTPMGWVQFTDQRDPKAPPEKCDWEKLEDFLRKRGRYPIPAMIRCAWIEEGQRRLQERIRQLEDDAAAHRHALTLALRKKLYLCFAEAGADGTGSAWFTTNLERQWGDDWNDAPYEHNAGHPYDFHRSWRLLPPGSPTVLSTATWPEVPYLLIRVDWAGAAFSDAAQNGYGGTAEEINRSRLPWLYYDQGDVRIALPAGTTFRTFEKAAAALGGKLVWPQPPDWEAP